MKIRKNLSDADMFRGVEEEESFETALLSDDSRRIKLRKNSKCGKSKNGTYAVKCFGKTYEYRLTPLLLLTFRIYQTL